MSMAAVAVRNMRKRQQQQQQQQQQQLQNNTTTPTVAVKGVRSGSIDSSFSQASVIVKQTIVEEVTRFSSVIQKIDQKSCWALFAKMHFCNHHRFENVAIGHDHECIRINHDCSSNSNGDGLLLRNLKSSAFSFFWPASISSHITKNETDFYQHQQIY